MSAFIDPTAVPIPTPETGSLDLRMLETHLETASAHDEPGLAMSLDTQDDVPGPYRFTSNPSPGIHSGSDETVAQNPVPRVPESLEDLGIQPSMIEQLILKFLYFRGELLGRELASLLGVQFSLIDDILETFKRQHFVGVKKSLGMGNMSGIFVLTEAGRSITREFLDNNQYAGPVPVPLEQYTDMVRRQKLREQLAEPRNPQESLRHLVVEADILGADWTGRKRERIVLDLWTARKRQDGPGGVLIPRGNRAHYMPHALECQGNIIQLYDPIYHQKIDDHYAGVSALSIQLPTTAARSNAAVPSSSPAAN